MPRSLPRSVRDVLADVLSERRPCSSMLLVGSVPVIAILVAAASRAARFPLLLRQVLLCLVGVGGIMVAERVLFGPDGGGSCATLGFVTPRPRAVVVAIIVSLPMWLFLPI